MPALTGIVPTDGLMPKNYWNITYLKRFAIFLYTAS
jgi:hypothetical protein